MSNPKDFVEADIKLIAQERDRAVRAALDEVEKELTTRTDRPAGNSDREVRIHRAAAKIQRLREGLK